MNSLNIEMITILTGNGADELLFSIKDKKSGVYPYTDQLKLTCKVAAGFGKEYCEIHFPNIKIHIINV